MTVITVLFSSWWLMFLLENMCLSLCLIKRTIANVAYSSKDKYKSTIPVILIALAIRYIFFAGVIVIVSLARLPFSISIW